MTSKDWKQDNNYLFKRKMRKLTGCNCMAGETIMRIQCTAQLAPIPFQLVFCGKSILQIEIILFADKTIRHGNISIFVWYIFIVL